MRIEAPVFGDSKDMWFCDAQKRRITKGLIALKGFGAGTGDRMYALAHCGKKLDTFTDVILQNKLMKSVNNSQLSSLIHIDFFKFYGNQRELDFILETVARFKFGEAKSMKRDQVDGTWLEPVMRKHATDLTKAGKPAASYTITDMNGLLYECEEYIRGLKMDDYDIFFKVNTYKDIMGSAGYVTGKEEDRSLLYLKDLIPIRRKGDGAQIGYSFVAQSVGSGKETRYSVWNADFKKEPVAPGDLIRCLGWRQNGQYYTMTSYRKCYPGEVET